MRAMLEGPRRTGLLAAWAASATLALALLPGCKLCFAGACKKAQGRVVTGVVPTPGGGLVITTCTMTTKGSAASLADCRDHTIPAPGAAAAEGGS